jgi:hypothetical protein
MWEACHPSRESDRGWRARTGVRSWLQWPAPSTPTT